MSELGITSGVVALPVQVAMTKLTTCVNFMTGKNMHNNNAKMSLF